MNNNKHNTSHREMRFKNIVKVIKSLQNGAKDKKEITEHTGLSWGSCFSIINMLCDKKIINYTLDGKSSGRGRKIHNYTFNNKKYLIYGMELRSNDILCSIANLANHEIFRKVYPFNHPLTSDNLFNNFNAIYINSLIDAKIKSNSILALSVALAGGVNTNDKIWTHAPRIEGINNFNFNNIFRLLPDIKYFFIEHDIHAQASSVLNANKWNESSYVFIHIGRGISSSIYNNGLFTGYRGYAGEIGHIPYINSPDNILDNYDVESSLSLKGIIDFVNNKFKTNIKHFDNIPKSIFNKKELQNHITKVLIYLLHIVSNLYDPRVIMIGGPSIEPFYDKIKRNIEEELHSVAFGGGPEKIMWYKSDDVFGAYGTIINTNKVIANKFTNDFLS